MALVRTVNGPVDSDLLGPTLLHEHVVFDFYQLSPPADYDWEQVTARALEEFEQLLAFGVKTLVDVTPIGNGRNPEVLSEIARRSGLHIVAATGFYRDPPLKELVGTEDVAALAEVMERELTVGMDDTSIRAGILKVATSETITPAELKVMQAAVQVSRKTGAAITTHTQRREIAFEQVDFFERAGVDLSRVVIGHLGDWPDTDFHLAIARRGVCIGYDRLGLNLERTAQCPDVIARLIQEGHISQVVISHDAPMYLNGKLLRSAMTSETRRRDCLYIHQEFLDKLREVGVTDEQIQTLLVENASRVLAF